MNIFYTNPDPFIAAQELCDKHLSKMIVETAQLLSSAHHITNSPIKDKVYKLTHKNHPCAIWVRENLLHYEWLYKYLMGTVKEFEYRRDKSHMTWDKLGVLLYNVPELPIVKWIDPPQCMPDIYKDSNTVLAYQSYYRSKEFAKWNWNREAPKWVYK